MSSIQAFQIFSTAVVCSFPVHHTLSFCMALHACLLNACCCLSVSWLSLAPPLFFRILTLCYAVGVQRSKSLENCSGEEKRERRISWGVTGPGQRRSLGKRRFSEELKRRRHTVAGDVR